jgi:hypothetical protein
MVRTAVAGARAHPALVLDPPLPFLMQAPSSPCAPHLPSRAPLEICCSCAFAIPVFDAGTVFPVCSPPPKSSPVGDLLPVRTLSPWIHLLQLPLACSRCSPPLSDCSSFSCGHAVVTTVEPGILLSSLINFFPNR